MQRKIVVPLIGGLVLVVLVGAGISFQLSKSSPESQTAKTAATPSSSASPLAQSPSPTQVLGDASFKDGTYRAIGSYQTPAGTEEVGVELTTANDVITAVTVTPEGRDPQSRQYEQRFASGISAVVVGKPLSEVSSVGKVNGSPLTGNGFQQALDVIKSKAQEG